MSFIVLPPLDASIPPEEYDKHVQQAIEVASEHPFDSRQPTDAAHKAAQAVLSDLEDRRSIGRVLEDLDEDVKTEITDILAAIIRKVMGQKI